MNTKLKTVAKTDFEKDFFKLMNNSVFGQTMENIRKHRDIKLVKTDERRNQLMSESNHHTTEWFQEDLLAIEMKKIKSKINKPLYLGSSILEISKNEFMNFGMIISNQNTNAKLCYMGTDNFIIHIKLKIFIKISQTMLKKDMIHLIMKLTDHYQKE